MVNLRLFPTDQIVGVFRGFSKGGLEFHADLVLPYRNEFQNIPMHGQFLLVQLESEDEAVLGRITSLSSAGKLSTGAGEEFNIRAVREGRAVPEDLREQYLKYAIEIRVLGVVRLNQEKKLTFISSHRRLPHVGSPVAFLSGDVLKEIAGHNVTGADIGHFALGEYIYAHDSHRVAKEDWMQVKEPEVLVRFPITNLVSRRTFVFARAGFGKSNLNKLLFSTLYKDTPTVLKRGRRQVPVGTVLFDPEGEYFWPDDKGRPGLCDVPELEDKLVVFTSREAPSEFYEAFVAGGIKIDIRRFSPSDVIGIALSPEKQDQQNVRKLKGLNEALWRELVGLISQHGHQTPIEDIRRILSLEEDRQDAEAYAARANMTTIVSMLHDRRSQLIDKLIGALSQGKLCVVDVSQMRGTQSMILSSLILRRIFDRNQKEFTSAEPRTIPTIAVVEEAQAVLNPKVVGSDPYIAWVKEGRKYDLGAVLITQQPGSIPGEILSQGDNWFIFHLLSAADLNSMKGANAHFSQDILSAILNEPIPGQGIFWSSSDSKPYPVAIRALSFEKMYPLRDPDFKEPAVATFACKLRNDFKETLERASEAVETPRTQDDMADPTGAQETSVRENDEGAEAPDPLETYEQQAIEGLGKDSKTMERIRNPRGLPWRGVMEALKKNLPSSLDDLDQVAYNLVPQALSQVLGGSQGDKWETYRSEKGTTFVREIPQPPIA